jgi:hypothetical protein
MRKSLVLGFVVFFIITSCRSVRKIQTPVPRTDTVSVVSVPETPREDSAAVIRENLTRIKSGLLDYTTFSAKIDVQYKDAEGKRINANAHLRMYRDSIIWVSLTGPLGIEGIRAFITKDSVKMLDKQEKILTTRSVSYLQEVTELPLDLYSLQNLLIGNPVFLDSNIISYTRKDGNLSLFSMGNFFKNIFTLNETDKSVQSSKLDDVDPSRSRTCFLGYSEYENKKEKVFSAKRTISITEKKKLDLELEFKQYDFNETLSFPFNVPKNYKRN